MLLESAERFLGEHSSSQVVRAAADLPSGVDMALWSRVTEELGWQVVAIPEACGGLGLGAVELVILLEKLGARLSPIPFFASALAAMILRTVPTSPEQTRLFEALAGGDHSEQVFTAIGEDWDVEARVHAQLDRLGLAGVSLDRSLRSLSGGEVVSLGLARELLRNPDILLLDEPTNNLDAAARERLDAALDDYTGLLVVVSHDRALLNSVVTDILHLEAQSLTAYKGNYDFFEKTRAERMALAAKQREKQEAQRAHIMSFVFALRCGHQPPSSDGAVGRPVPIIQSRVTQPASSSSLRPSVPSGRMGSTR